MITVKAPLYRLLESWIFYAPPPFSYNTDFSKNTLSNRGRHPRNEKSPPDLILPLLPSSSPHPIDRANSRYGAVISMAEDRRGIYNVPERGRNFTLVRLTRVSEVFVITHAPSDRLVNRACFMYSLNGDILPTVLENSFRCETMEGRKVDGIERQRSLLCVYRFYGDRKKVWDPFFSPPPRKRIVDYRSVRQISRSLSMVRSKGRNR